MTSTRRYIAFFFGAAVLATASAVSIHNRSYGLTLFIALPMALGALAAWAFRAKSAGDAVGCGIMANVVAMLGFFALGLDGFICVLMAMPLVVPLGALGGWLAYAATHEGRWRAGLRRCCCCHSDWEQQDLT
jgi:hypothetical protein